MAFTFQAPGAARSEVVQEDLHKGSKKAYWKIRTFSRFQNRKGKDSLCGGALRNKFLKRGSRRLQGTRNRMGDG